jgi:hypothetical protein
MFAVLIATCTSARATRFVQPDPVPVRRRFNFPADINTHLAPMFGFPGTMIDGQTVPVSPPLSASANRY